jgi:hypothetical protein
MASVSRSYLLASYTPLHTFRDGIQFRVCLKSALHIIVCGEAVHTKRTKTELKQNCSC